jgi:hypothetical protein
MISHSWADSWLSSLLQVCINSPSSESILQQGPTKMSISLNKADQVSIKTSPRWILPAVGKKVWKLQPIKLDQEYIDLFTSQFTLK